MTAPARRLRAVPTRPLCAACRQPMTPVNGHTTHPCCDPVYGWAPYGGQAQAPPDEPPRQLRLVT